MTDLQQHLKGIQKIVRQRLDASAPADSLDMTGLRADLRDFLPGSYGIGAGRIYSGDSDQTPHTHDDSRAADYQVVAW